MGFMDRLVSRRQPQEPLMRQMAADEMQEAADGDGELVEVEVVGESHRQDVLAALAGPKQPDGKRARVGVTLRCEPSNLYDENAIRVEVMGQLTGYVSRSQTELLAPAIQRSCGGAIEAVGMIVGGWRNEVGYADVSEGHYGIRVWLTQRDAQRLAIRPDDLDVRLRAQWPAAPAVDAGERRLSPTDEDLVAERFGSWVTVTCEEHYQPSVEASMPAGWNPGRTWPLLVDLVVVASNPHTTKGTSCIEVRYGHETIGYMTPKMSDRHVGVIVACTRDGLRATAMANASRGTKGGVDVWRVKVHLA